MSSHAATCHAAGHFSDRLAAALDRVGSPACVGLDPVLEKLPLALRPAPTGPADPVEVLRAYGLAVLDAIAPSVAVVKLQSACFERYHAPGLNVLTALIHRARDLGLIVVLDAKRGDIGISADHYAAASTSAGADAITINGYLGPDTIDPFLAPGHGAFVLVRTSNPGSDAVQSQRLVDGRTVAEMMGDLVAGLGASRTGSRGLSDLGAVVGATKAADGRALRARMPNQVFLVPGYGAQGGTLNDCRALLRPGRRSPGDAGVLITASRSVIYAFDPTDPGWAASVAAAANTFAAELRGLFTT
ncbi:MAG: orotidine-5'-phosphate decarboxylase [Phycisphaeraceae bacterium]|nr:orotidine-5'-phosphate decarboxylase [Phycisphaeraceae bacterium]